MSSIFNVLIVGAGNIGAFYDFPESENILSHAHAFSNHNGFKLLGFVDTDFAKAQKAAEIWGVKCFNTIENAFSENTIDVVCVAVPDEFHYDILMKISEYPVKLVFAEKPLAGNMPEADKIKQIYKEKKIPICVNYIRRFIPEFKNLKERILNNEFGKFISGSGLYGKGLLHNGSHLIDFLRFFIGEFQPLCSVNKISDFYPEDPSLTAILSFENNSIFCLNAIDSRLFTIVETDFIFEKGRIRIKELGHKIELYRTQDNKIFKGYRNLIEEKEISTSFYNYLFFAAENIYQYLRKIEPLQCTMEDGYIALKLCHDIKNSKKAIKE